MTDLPELRARLAAARVDLVAASEELDVVGLRLTEARRVGDLAAAKSAERDRDRLREAHRHAAETAFAQEQRLIVGIGGVLPPQASPEDAAIDGVDEGVPLALLPVRLETRLVDGHLKVRIFPDDLHVDDHEPLLDATELAAGKDYWSAVGADPAESAAAWNRLGAVVGAYRALWVRRATAPDAAAPQTEPRVGVSRPAMAIALPDVFMVRVRAGRREFVVAGGPVLDALQVGVPMSGADDPLLDEDGGMPGPLAWLSDFTAAQAAGMAVDIDLEGAGPVRDVTVVGVSVSQTPEESATALTELIDRHSVTHGAGFVAPGTPTNNLSDSPSGMTFSPDPSGLDPAALAAASPTSDASVLARALGLDPAALADLPGAAGEHVAAQGAMQRALFEATWGPYLREYAVPAFDPHRIPLVRSHVTQYMRPGGPLPVLRLGRQPYGILPVQPPASVGGDGDAAVRWLEAILPRVRDLWTSGLADAPHGLDILGHEPYSTSVQVRSINAMYSRIIYEDLGFPSDDAASVQQRRLLAELGITGARPRAIFNLFADPAPLRLPMAAAGDLDFNARRPDPKSAGSLLGLLLRNAALQLLDTASDTVIDDGAVELQGYGVQRAAGLAMPMLADVAVSVNDQVSMQARPSLDERLAVEVEVAGATTTVGEHLNAIIDGRFDDTIQLERYGLSDALRAFSRAVAELKPIAVEERARLVGQAIDAASHRYDAWVTSLATRRLDLMRTARPGGIQLGAWGYVSGVPAQSLTPVPDREGVFTDAVNRGWVLAPSPRHASTAGVLRAAWTTHGGTAASPFAVDLPSARVRQALGLAQGMREGQPLGALLGYRIERLLHEAHDTHNLEADWVVYPLRRAFPLRVRTLENAGPSIADERLVVDGWAVVRAEAEAPGTVRAKIDADTKARFAGADQAKWLAAMAALGGLLDEVLTDAAAAIDSLADLGMGEAMFQLSGSNFERAAAATDVIGRAAVPPDVYELARTPRMGAGIDQRLVIVFGGHTRPSGYADDTPRALLSPQADAFVAERLGPLAGLSARVQNAEGREIGAVALSALGLAALDFAADAARTDVPRPFPLLTSVAVAAGPAGGVDIGLDQQVDAALLTFLRRAAAWHRALASGIPLAATSFVGRGAQTSTPTAAAGSIAQVRAALTDARAGLFGIVGDDAGRAAEADRRRSAADAATDAIEKARALFGTAPVLEGETVVPAPWLVAAGDQAGLTIEPGAIDGWLQDTARVREPARALDEALLLDGLTVGTSLPLSAAQVPVQPYRESASRAWVGGIHPAPLAREPVTSMVVVGHALTGTVVGIELDSWNEVVPDRAGIGAVAANLPAPDARAPNTVLLAVPGQAEWTRRTLFGVVDEALALADARTVDLDAAKRVPMLLPAIYITEYDTDPVRWLDVVTDAAFVKTAWRSDVTGWTT